MQRVWQHVLKEKSERISVNYQFNDWGGRGCSIFVPVLGVNSTKIAPTGDIFDLPPDQMR